MKTASITTILILVCTTQGGTFVDGFHRTTELANQTSRGPTLLITTSNAAIYLTRGVVYADKQPRPLPAPTVTDRTVKYQNRFAFSHLDRKTLTQKWLFASGVFGDGAMVPHVKNQRICGMTWDTDHFWLLIWSSSAPKDFGESDSPLTLPRGSFRVMGFLLETGDRDVDVAFAYDEKNYDMWSWIFRFGKDPLDFGTPDFLGDMSIYRNGDALMILGTTNSVEELKRKNANQNVNDTR
jgi:hypothetical protein